VLLKLNPEDSVSEKELRRQRESRQSETSQLRRIRDRARWCAINESEEQRDIRLEHTQRRERLASTPPTVCQITNYQFSLFAKKNNSPMHEYKSCDTNIPSVAT